MTSSHLCLTEYINGQLSKFENWQGRCHDTVLTVTQRRKILRHPHWFSGKHGVSVGVPNKNGIFWFRYLS